MCPSPSLTFLLSLTPVARYPSTFCLPTRISLSRRDRTQFSVQLPRPLYPYHAHRQPFPATAQTLPIPDDNDGEVSEKESSTLNSARPISSTASEAPTTGSRTTRIATKPTEREVPAARSESTETSPPSSHSLSSSPNGTEELSPTQKSTSGNLLHSTDVPEHPSPEGKETFEQLYLEKTPKWLLQRLLDLGFEVPTPIQRAVLPLALPKSSTLPGQDVVIHAQTGSGKTLAYAIPIISAIVPERSCIQALVVVPTQELGMQVYKLLRRLTSAYNNNRSTSNVKIQNESDYDESDDDIEIEFDDDDTTDVGKDRVGSFPVLPMLNQANLRRQKLQLRQLAPRIIVGNPARIAQLVQSGRLRLDLLKVLVIDEFDACLSDTRTTQALQTIMSVRNKEYERQTILASATVPQHRHFLRQCVRQRWAKSSIRHVWLDEKSGVRLPPSLSHYYALCNPQKKPNALRSLIDLFHKRHGNLYAIVFVMAQRNVDAIVNSLNKALRKTFTGDNDSENDDEKESAPVVGIYNDMPVVVRKEAIQRFRSMDARVLIGTDVAARGLDFTHVSHVFHFDLPTDPDAYLHRAGRAGRQGRPGSSVVMIVPGEEFVVTRTSNKLGIGFERVTK